MCIRDSLIGGVVAFKNRDKELEKWFIENRQLEVETNKTFIKRVCREYKKQLDDAFEKMMKGKNKIDKEILLEELKHGDNEEWQDISQDVIGNVESQFKYDCSIDHEDIFITIRGHSDYFDYRYDITIPDEAGTGEFEIELNDDALFLIKLINKLKV